MKLLTHIFNQLTRIQCEIIIFPPLPVSPLKAVTRFFFVLLCPILRGYFCFNKNAKTMKNNKGGGTNDGAYIWVVGK
jgi:hypothetical protein